MHGDREEREWNSEQEERERVHGEGEEREWNGEHGKEGGKGIGNWNWNWNWKHRERDYGECEEHGAMMVRLLP